MKLQIFIISLSLVVLLLPNFSFAQEEFGAATPQTVGEAKDFITTILAKLPEAVKRIWQEEALPLWQRMWEWLKPFIEPWWNKALSLLNREAEKRKTDIEKEFRKEKQEMQNDLWQRFRDLIKQSI